MKLILVAALLGIATLSPVWAQVTVKNAWVRATVPQQKVTGVFLEIESAQDARLVSASSSAAPIVEVHETSLHDGVMRMRPVEAVALPAGKTVALEPGGHHIMLMNLKQPIRAGDAVAITLVIETPAGQRQSLQVTAEARLPGSSPGQPVDHSRHKHHP